MKRVLVVPWSTAPTYSAMPVLLCLVGACSVVVRARVAALRWRRAVFGDHVGVGVLAVVVWSSEVGLLVSLLLRRLLVGVGPLARLDVALGQVAVGVVAGAGAGAGSAARHRSLLT